MSFQIGQRVTFQEERVGGHGCRYTFLGYTTRHGVVTKIEAPDPFGIVWVHVLADPITKAERRWPGDHRLGSEHLSPECAA